MLHTYKKTWKALSKKGRIVMKRFIKHIIFFTFFVLVVMIKIDVVHARPLVAIDLSSTKVNVGEEFSVHIIITGENIEDMATWGGTLLFDSTFLSLQGVKAGSFTVPDTTFLSNQPEPGKLIMLEYGLSRSVASGQGRIAEVSFIPSKPGKAFIKLSNFAFADADGKEVFTDIGNDKTLAHIIIRSKK